MEEIIDSNDFGLLPTTKEISSPNIESVEMLKNVIQPNPDTNLEISAKSSEEVQEINGAEDLIQKSKEDAVKVEKEDILKLSQCSNTSPKTQNENGDDYSKRHSTPQLPIKNEESSIVTRENTVDTVSNLEVKQEETHANTSSSLALLAQYDTDDDSEGDNVREVPLAQSYQNRCVEIDSDSSTSDVEFLSEHQNPINLDMFDLDNEVGGEEEDDEEGNLRTSRQPRVKGELQLEDLPPIEDLHITVPEEECTELGKIHSIVEQLVLVNALPGTVPLDLNTVLFRDKGKKVLGEVFDVLGQVSDPLYCVRFNSNKEIKIKGIEIGQTIYVAPRTEHTQFIVLANLMKERGSDASWENDVEPPPRFIDYSDDEEERAAKRPNRKRQFSVGSTYSGRGSYTPRRPYRGSNNNFGGVRQPGSQTQRNYNIVGNSWHSNFQQPPMFNQPQYRTPIYPTSSYNRPNFSHTHFQQSPLMNTGMVINPYAVYPPPPVAQTPYLPHHQTTPPPPPPQ